MRSATVRNATILGLLSAGALLAGCSTESASDGATPVATQSPIRTAPVPAPPAVSTGDTTANETVPKVSARPLAGSVDAAEAKAAWSEGVGLFGQGDYAGAVPKLELAVAGHPEDAYRRYLLGLVYWKSGALEEADAELVESSKLAPQSVKTWVNLARVRNARDDREGALDASSKGLEFDPSSAEALHQQGRALMELNRGEEALASLAKARELDPGNGYIANTLGLLLIQSGRSGEAIEPLEHARTQLPGVAFVRNNLGVAYERTGRTDEARIEFQAALDAGDSGGKAAGSLARLGAPVGEAKETTLTAAAEPSETAAPSENQ